MNKNARMAVATQLRRVLEIHDAEVFIDDEPLYRSTHVTAVFPGVVSVSLDIDDLHKGGALASWHSAKGKLSPAVFPGVNPYHHHKATSYCTSFAAMVEHLDQIGAAIVDGRAFIPA
jgi:hypothetical protein